VKAGTFASRIPVAGGGWRRERVPLEIFEATHVARCGDKQEERAG